MTTVRKARPSVQAPGVDPFFYGWRYIERTGKNGRKHPTTVPLTFENVLHPQEGDHIVNNDLHADDCAYLRDVFRSGLSAFAGALVLSDTGV